MLKHIRNLMLGAMLTFAFPPSAMASSPHCPSSDLLGGGILKNICWRCIFPIKVAGLTLFGSGMTDSGTDANGFALSSKPTPPSNAANKVGCFCMDGAKPVLGIPMGMWLPSTLYENVLVPGCSPFLAGTVVGVSDPLYLGDSGDPTEDLGQQSFNHVHTYSYPVVLLMELFTRCNHGYQDIDMLYMSEIDPMWNDPTVAMYGNPLSVFGASISAVAACSADAVASTAGKPIDRLFWCAGAWTSTLSPYTGYQHAMGPVQYTSSSSLRLLAMNHLRGFERKTVGNDALCSGEYDPTLDRSNYRWSTAWPNPQGRSNHASGESILRWGAGRTIPGIAEQPIYLQWKWTDCCAPLIGR